MLEVEGRVVGIETAFAWIIREGKQTCGNCDPKMGCKSMAISRLFCKKEPIFRVRDPLGVLVGERVSIAIEENVLLQGAMTGYGMPVLALILGAVVGLFLGKEYLSMIGGVMGFLVAMLWLRRTKVTLGNMPIILRRILEDKQLEIIHDYGKKEE